VILTSGKGLISSYFFVLHPLSQGLSILPDIFLRKGIMKPALPGVFYCPPAWSCPQVFNSGLGIRLYEGRFGFWQGVVFMQNFWNFKAIPDTEIILTSIQSKLILKQFKWFLWRGFQKWWKLFVLILVKNMKWHLVGKKYGLKFNLKVTENRFSKHLFYLHE